MLIKNYEKLISHGQIKVRKTALELTETALSLAHPGKGTEKLIRRNENILKIKNNTYDLEKINNIYIIGIGKASFYIVQVLEQIIGKKITEGILLTKKGSNYQLKKCRTLETGHPLPDRYSLQGAKEVANLCKSANKDDLVFTAITGGATSLCWLPPEGISIKDLQIVSDLLLESGADIGEMNTVRRHLGRLKGGGLLNYINPAENVTLTIKTIPEDENIPWPDLTVSDSSTYKDAITILKIYNLWQRTPETIKKFLQQGKRGLRKETLKDISRYKTSLYSVGSPRYLCNKVAQKARAMGYQVAVLASYMEGEAKDVGICLASITKQIKKFNHPFVPPCVLISGGETTVSINDGSGQGGPNQEFVLGYARAIKREFTVACIALDTDGIDGRSEFAGGIVDGKTQIRAQKKDIDLQEALLKHNSSRVLSDLNDVIYTGPTGTNLQDFRLIIIEDSGRG